MRQYQRIKDEYPDAILLFRMGDFFETFEDDAVVAANVLGITLTRRSNGGASDVPLAGFPHHAIDAYLPKLVRAGYRVAVCEQLEDPKLAKGLVKRDVVEVVTPGVVFSDRLLDHKHFNFLGSVALMDDVAGLAFADASTGEFVVMQVTLAELRDQLELFAPREILVAKKDADRFHALFGLHQPDAAITRLDDWLYARDTAYEILVTHFHTHSLKGFGVDALDAAIQAAGAALHYLKETQKAALPHLQTLRRHDASHYVTLDAVTRRNLEITVSMGDGGRDGSLISILDRTRTSMGARMFSSWITHPLRNVSAIRDRHDAVHDLVDHTDCRAVIVTLLDETVDYERLIARVSTGRATPRELNALCASLRRVPLLRDALDCAAAPLLIALRDQLLPLDDVVTRIERTLADNAPQTVAEGGVIRSGFHVELDEIRGIAEHGREWLASFQDRIRRETGIASLKVEFNRAFGYSITVSNANRDKVPETFIRRQTLVNAERYVTPELKTFEENVLSAKEQILRIESELFDELRIAVAASAARIQALARAIATLDTLVSFATSAVEHRYVRPDVTDGHEIAIVDGRHPVVERRLPPGERFIGNDTHLSADEQIMIITGPNMSGKSTYLRQVGLIVLLAQAGSFVPATSARIGAVDRIFTRVGASDNIAAGESTFLVEMQEAANILNNATPDSLVLLDEVGRGTSTFDGISIAWAMTEYLHDHPGSQAKTLFATHYHELNEMADILPRIRNYKVDVREYRDRVIFLRTVSRGTADHSYGIQVAQMAGLPGSVIARAKDVLRSLEGQDLTVLASRRDDSGAGTPRRGGGYQISLFESVDAELRERIRAIDVNALTPVQAWAALEELKKRIE